MFVCFFSQKRKYICNVYARKGLFQSGNHQYIRHTIKYNKTKFCQCSIQNIAQILNYILAMFFTQALQIFTRFASPFKHHILKYYKAKDTCFKYCLRALELSDQHILVYLRSLHNGPLKEVMLQSQLNPSHCCKHTPWFAHESSWHVVLGPDENIQKRTCTLPSK